ncbi:MAG: Spx/MgsR family RNA polymerase-binding regulatory protein [Kofleriaceae bacterium]|nr:Spx/MgsR family RNA polymerase-binding regulatory protein [Myxococcales bacterium]MCB9561558.1 Spx/MgsR family RNA polymerase-binding regulatory protein [Kofleriaceae bacterium]MCB9572276.1 Spx/MgsR family RNA polymerase-binding regulatory protein [Kofleriaceae bacterium]
MALIVYQYPKCGTCRKALAWLDGRGVAYRKVDIVEAPPPRRVLEQALRAGVPLRKLFNTSGESYRHGNFKERLATMSEAEALAALTADGKLIKRPLAVDDDLALVGFDEAAWAKALPRGR